MAQPALKIEPKGEWLSTSEIAKRCKIHRQTCAARLEDLGYDPDAERSNAKKAVFWFDDEMEFAIKSAKDTFTATKIRDMRASAQMKEHKLSVMRGEYVEVGEMVEIVQRIVSNIHQEYTVRQPKRLAAKLAKSKSVTAVKAALKADTDRIMKNLRENFARFIA